MTSFPWSHVMHAGLGVLRLPPSEFWKMTPRELAGALGAQKSAAGCVDRETLQKLMKQFPDREAPNAT